MSAILQNHRAQRLPECIEEPEPQALAHSRRAPPETPRPRRSSQSGLAIAEVLVLTAPLCALTLAITARLADTSSRRLESMTSATVRAQKATRTPCGGDVELGWPIAPAIDQKVMRSWEVQALSALTILPTRMETVSATVPMRVYGEGGSQGRRYQFHKAAASMVPDPSADRSITSEATFVCNEPDRDSSREILLEAEVLGLATLQARRIYKR